MLIQFKMQDFQIFTFRKITSRSTKITPVTELTWITLYPILFTKTTFSKTTPKIY